MAVPEYQRLMLPLLQLAGDRKEHTVREACEALARHFGLNEEDRREMMPSGGQRKFEKRVAWARTYLTKACLLANAGRARFIVTERGCDVLRAQPAEIDSRFLRQFPEFREFQRGPTEAPAKVEQEEDGSKQTPEEILAGISAQLQKDLAQNLLARIKGCSFGFFERLVVDLLVAMGYGGSHKDAGQAVGQSSDGGIDGIIKEDKLGLDVVYIQAKRWEGVVGRPIVQAFAGSLEGRRARKGVLISTSPFSREAHEYVSIIEKKIVLIDGEQLAQYLIDYGIGVSEAATYSIKRIDLDYFSEEE